MRIPAMDSLAAVFVVVSSVGLSIGISRLAVGEMFRLVRSDAKKRGARDTVVRSSTA